MFSSRKNKLLFLYGKWTDFIRCTDYASFEDYYKDHSEKFRRGAEKESSQTPKKVLAKLNSLKMGVSFSKSQSAATDVCIPESMNELNLFFLHVVHCAVLELT